MPIVKILFIAFGLALVMQPASAASLPDFTTLVKENYRSVVHIKASAQDKVPSAPNPNIPREFQEGPFGDLWRRFFEQQQRPQPAPQAIGSGFIISKDGYLLTNYHVVREVSAPIVKMHDQREYTARVIGSDRMTDVSLLKIDAKEPLPAVKIGNSETLDVGAWVAAIGSPFGFEHTVTAGIVSAKSRQLPNENYVPFIQTDVAINPGNSGGPLFNLAGEVIGINAQIFTNTGRFSGLSFAIPIEVAMNVVEQLQSTGRVERGWLGVHIQKVTQELAESFDMRRPKGALITQVLPDSPAQRAGLASGDIIMTFDGQEIAQMGALPPLVSRTKIGRTVMVDILRNGRQKTLRIKIAPLPQGAQDTPVAEASDKGFDRLGLTIDELSDEQRDALDVRGGVMVRQVKQGAAQNAGLRSGDIIIQLNNHEIQNLAQYQYVIKQLRPGRSYPLLIRRGNGALFLALKVLQ